MHPFLLAQATINADTLFGWPVVVAVATLFVWAGRQQMRLEHQTTALAEIRGELTLERNERGALDKRVTGSEIILGEIRAMLREVRDDLRATNAVRKEAA